MQHHIITDTGTFYTDRGERYIDFHGALVYEKVDDDTHADYLQHDLCFSCFAS